MVDDVIVLYAGVCDVVCFGLDDSKTKEVIMDKQLAQDFHNALNEDSYAHRFSWMGVPIIQEPQDMVALQELVWRVKPDLIIETGIAHGGSVLFSASMMMLLDREDGSKIRDVVGIDIDIRPPTLDAVCRNPLKYYITMIEGDSTSPAIIERVYGIAKEHEKIMVLLDSNHTHAHVLSELKAYAPLVTIGSYCVVFDTGVEDLPDYLQATNRPWGKGNNPKTAVHEFLKENIGFAIDKEIEDKLIITSSPDGWLKRVW